MSRRRGTRSTVPVGGASAAARCAERTSPWPRRIARRRQICWRRSGSGRRCPPLLLPSSFDVPAGALQGIVQVEEGPALDVEELHKRVRAVAPAIARASSGHREPPAKATPLNSAAAPASDLQAAARSTSSTGWLRPVRDKLYGHLTKRKGRTKFLAFCRHPRSLHPAQVRIAVVLDNFSPAPEHQDRPPDRGLGRGRRSPTVGRVGSVNPDAP